MEALSHVRDLLVFARRGNVGVIGVGGLSGRSHPIMTDEELLRALMLAKPGEVIRCTYGQLRGIAPSQRHHVRAPLDYAADEAIEGPQHHVRGASAK